MLIYANAKINIGLYITGKRSDGFHELQSIFYPVNFITDIIEIVESKEFSFDGYNLPQGNFADNLVVKGYNLLKRDFNLPPVEIYLAKKIPVGAGLGGGSADAAFTLRLLNQMFNLNIDIGKLEKYAVILGSDCPFFIQNKTSFVSGRGDVLETLDFSLKGWFLSVIFPGIHISTKNAFEGIKPKEIDVNLNQLLPQLSVNEWKMNIKNDFEVTLFIQFPKLKEIKDALYKKGATYASLSGSGSAIFALSQNKLNLNGVDFAGCEIWQQQV